MNGGIKDNKLSVDTDMEKGADTRTLSAEIFENCGNFLIVEDYAPLFSEENIFLVEMFDETFNIWYIYSLKMIHNNSSYCEKFRDTFFAEIFIVDKTRLRKDLIFFHVCIEGEKKHQNEFPKSNHTESVLQILIW